MATITLTADQKAEALRYVYITNIVDMIRSGEVLEGSGSTLTPDTADAVEALYAEFWAEGAARLAAMDLADLLEIIREEVRVETEDSMNDYHGRSADVRINGTSAANEIARRIAA